MKNQDWIVTSQKFQPCNPERDWNLLQENYRFYRFLTEIEDTLTQTNHLPKIRQLVRKLILNSYWIKTRHLPASPQTGTSVLELYDELGFPLTVQTVTFAPGIKSNIHNHGTWGVIALLQGQEKNTIWQQNPDQKLQKVGEIILNPGDIISFTPDAIHSIESIGDEPTITFNIYGETDPSQRFEFDPFTNTTKHF
jgi:predicted metal-dependent enzyme (double-stranded beta helix superfamily)